MEEGKKCWGQEENKQEGIQLYPRHSCRHYFIQVWSSSFWQKTEIVLWKSYKHLPPKENSVSSWMKTPPGLMTAYVHYKDCSALTILGFCQHTTIKLMVWLQHKKNLIVCILHTHPSDQKSLPTTLRQLYTQWVCIFHIRFSSTDFCYSTLQVCYNSGVFFKIPIPATPTW